MKKNQSCGEKIGKEIDLITAFRWILQQNSKGECAQIVQTSALKQLNVPDAD